jgi:hypothetical protein
MPCSDEAHEVPFAAFRGRESATRDRADKQWILTLDVQALCNVNKSVSRRCDLTPRWVCARLAVGPRQRAVGRNVLQQWHEATPQPAEGDL